MDDEDSKIRRNLIAVSVLMILVWWLGAPLDKVSEKFFGVPPNGPAFEWRVWLAAMLALGYFSVRYRFCKEHQDSIEGLRTDWDAIEAQTMTKWISVELWLYSRFGIFPRTLGVFFPKVVDRATKGPTYGVGTNSEQFDTVLSIKVRSVMVGLYNAGRYKRKTGNYQVNLTVRSLRPDGVKLENEDSVSIELGPGRNWVRRCASSVWLFWYSKTGAGLLVPWALVLFAAVVGGYKLAISW